MGEFDQLQRTWDELAKLDPLYFLSPSHKWSVEDFFQSGASHVRRDLAWVEGAGVRLARGRALDFGCGVGRQTQSLALEFDECWGVDISTRMIELARQFNRVGNRCRYVVNATNDLRLFDDGQFDFVYSNNALCHVSPEGIRNYLAEFIRVLRAPGVLMFQVPVRRLGGDTRAASLRSLPSYHPRRVLNKLRGMTIGHDVGTRYERLRKVGLSSKWIYERLGYRPAIPVNTLPDPEIRDLLSRAGIVVAAVHTYTFEDRLDAVFIAEKRS